MDTIYLTSNFRISLFVLCSFYKLFIHIMHLCVISQSLGFRRESLIFPVNPGLKMVLMAVQGTPITNYEIWRHMHMCMLKFFTLICIYILQLWWVETNLQKGILPRAENGTDGSRCFTKDLDSNHQFCYFCVPDFQQIAFIFKDVSLNVYIHIIMHLVMTYNWGSYLSIRITQNGRQFQYHENSFHVYSTDVHVQMINQL